MSLADTIASLANLTVTVTRRAKGTFTNGIYTPGAATTFSIDVCMQPAFGLNRVVGGADMSGKVDNQSTTDVRDFFTTTLMHTRSSTTDPDTIFFEGADWTVARVETWGLNDDVHYRCVCTRSTGGAA